MMTSREAIRLLRNLPTMCEFTDAYGEPIDSDAYYEAVDMAISALNAQPEIVRCKECKYWHREIHNNIEYINYSSCDLNHWGDGHNFYCADAERRTDAGSD